MSDTSTQSSIEPSTARSWWTPAHGASAWLWLSLLVIVLDQMTKALVVRNIELYERVRLLPVLDITHLLNTGAAFSMLANAGGWQRWFFTVLALGVSVMLIVWLRRLTKQQTLLAVGLSLILGGAIGNVIDRVWLGHVRDFIYVHWDRIGFSFAAFNVADSAICIGAGCLLLDSFLEGRKPIPDQKPVEKT